MTTDIKELVKQLAAGRTLLLRADGDRDLGFQSNITTNTSMALADELKSAIDALEAMAGEVEALKGERDGADRDRAWAMSQRAGLLLRAEAAEAERDRLKAALVEVEDRLNCRGNPDIAHYCPNCDNSLHNAREIARKALGDAS